MLSDIFKQTPLPTHKVLDEVEDERIRQDRQWGEQNHNPDRWLAILLEECGEAAHAANEQNQGWYRAELIQVAAVAVAAIECLDREKW